MLCWDYQRGKPKVDFKQQYKIIKKLTWQKNYEI